jgi:hypothetical protein
MPLTNQFRALTRTSISPHQSAQIDLMPGRYVVNAIINDAASPRPFALAGLLSVTNRETWIFKLEEQPPTSASVRAQHLVLEIPSRPGFHFTGFTDRSLPPRAPRTNLPPFQYQIMGTNSLRMPPHHELNLPPTNR